MYFQLGWNAVRKYAFIAAERPIQLGPSITTTLRILDPKLI